MTISEDRAHRIENKLDDLITTVNRLAVLDERQVNMIQWLQRVESAQKEQETKLDTINLKVDRWINMGIGAWSLMCGLLFLYQTFRVYLT